MNSETKTGQRKRIALVTGASRGLGEAAAVGLAAQGIFVLVGVRDKAASEEIASRIKEAGGDAQVVSLDITQASAIEAVARKIADDHGHLDILINNAAVMLDGGWLGNTAISIDANRLRETFETNFFATVALTQALWPLLEKAGAANVVNVSSRMGSNTLHADPAGPLAGAKPFAYDASKAALNAFTTHLAEIGRTTGVQVNSAYPGWVRTELGTEYAEMSVKEGVETILQLALLPANSRTGQFEHLGQPVPW